MFKPVAKPKTSTRTNFKNCTDLRTVYTSGIQKSPGISIENGPRQRRMGVSTIMGIAKYTLDRVEEGQYDFSRVSCIPANEVTREISKDDIALISQSDIIAKSFK